MHRAHSHASHGVPQVRPPHRGPLLALLLVTLLSPACATTTAVSGRDRAVLDRLVALILERLAVAPDVARTKWNSGAPIEDLTRERQIVSSVGAGASDYQLPREVAERVFQAQIEASKIIQTAMHEEFRAAHQPPFATVVDLGREIRPVLDRLTPEIMRALADALPTLQRPGGRKALEVRSRQLVVEVPGGKAAVRAAMAPLLDASR